MKVFAPRQVRRNLPNPAVSLSRTGRCLVAACTFACVGCDLVSTPETVRPELIRPVLSVVASTSTDSTIGYSGTIDSRYQSDLSFRLVGRIETRLVNPGDMVRTGQVLATLDVTEPKIAVRSAVASLEIANAERKNAQKKLERQQTLRTRNATSETEYESAKKGAESAKSSVTEAESALDKAREVLSYAELTAEMNGVVTDAFAEIGETVRPGQIVVTVADPNQLEAVIDVADEFAERMQLGTEFRLLLPPGNVETTGQVREIAPQADAKTKTRRIRITILAPPKSFQLGATIRAIPAKQSEARIRLPASSILDRDGETFVWVVDEENSSVHLVDVTLVSRNEKNATIEKGIAAGDRVVIAGVHRLGDGQQVLIPTGDSE